MLSAMKGGKEFYNVLRDEGGASEDLKSTKDGKDARELKSERSEL